MKPEIDQLEQLVGLFDYFYQEGTRYTDEEAEKVTKLTERLRSLVYDLTRHTYA